MHACPLPSPSRYLLGHDPELKFFLNKSNKRKRISLLNEFWSGVGWIFLGPCSQQNAMQRSINSRSILILKYYSIFTYSLKTKAKILLWPFLINSTRPPLNALLCFLLSKRSFTYQKATMLSKTKKTISFLKSKEPS